jgi:hypothetical protein
MQEGVGAFSICWCPAEDMEAQGGEGASEGPRARWRQNQDSNPCSLAPESGLLTLNCGMLPWVVKDA